MSSITKYPTNITQTSGGNFRTFNNLNNLMNNNNTYAKSSNRIQGKSGTYKRPSTITCTGFNFNLPIGSEITSIVVEYAHQKIDYTKDKYPSIAAPTISLVASGIGSEYSSYKGAAPSKTMTARNNTWDGKYTKEVITDIKSQTAIIGGTQGLQYTTKKVVYEYNLPLYTTVNNAAFGVKINYPANTSTYEGWLQLKYVRITVNYKPSTYSFVVNSTSNVYIGDTVRTAISINNLNKTRYKPNITITLPEHCTLQSYDGIGSLIQNQNGTYTWESGIERNYSSTIYLNLVFDDDCETSLSVSENLNNAHKEFDFTVLPTPSGYDEDVETFEANEIVFAVNNVAFDLVINAPEALLASSSVVKLYTDKAISYDNNGTWTSISAGGSISIPVSSFISGQYILSMKSSSNGLTYLSLATDNNTPNNASYVVKVVPDDLDYPSITIFKLSENDLNTLADTFTYAISSQFKINVDLADVDLFHDYYRNFRLGVYNGPDFDSQIAQNVFDNCKIWSSVMTVLNEEEEKTISFQYDKEYPVYIIVTGEYTGGSPLDFNFNFTMPILYELNESWSADCILPSPLENVIAADDLADISIPNFKSSNPFVCYEFPFDEDFQTGENIAIRGVELGLDITANEEIGISATLKSPTGEIGSNSFIISSENEEHLTIGGPFDLWGFDISDMVELANWELELQLSNNFNNPNGHIDISLNNVTLTFYFMEVENTVVKCWINGEDIRWYGMFLKSAEVPKGLSMDTKYITNEGTDTNSPITQNIKESEIKLEFGVHGCDIFETSQLLNEISKLIINERDKLNKPIPNIIEFEHFPGEHWEYICNKNLDYDVEAADYETSITLDVPTGTSFANYDTVTGSTGVVRGAAKVNPIITITNISGETVEIIESNTEQKFTINYPFTQVTVDTVEIDCINRKVHLKTSEEEEIGQDITNYADFNSDWFILYGRFSFSSSNCIVQSTRFNERG